jgi:SCP-2 sterol transfer family
VLERLPTRFRLPGFTQCPIDAERWPVVRYRLALAAARARSYDLVVESGKARLEPSDNARAAVTVHCDRATFALMMYKRLTLDPAVAQGRVTIEGDHALTAVLAQWLKQP